MAIERFDHYSIRTNDVETTGQFYTEMLGLEVGPRPNFPFPGLWLYGGGVAVVHLIGVEPSGPSPNPGGTGALDHVAFLGSDLPGTRAKFAAANLPFRETTVPGLGLKQLFVSDPNGITIELNFPQ